MNQRHFLIIGSQCQAIQRPLSFLPRIARGLFRVMTNPEIGNCSPQASRLLEDPKVEDAKTAIKGASMTLPETRQRWSWPLSGMANVGKDFYLLFRDSPAERVDDDNALHLVNLVKGQYRNHSNLDGLVALVDACYSGAAATAAATGSGS